MRSMVNSSNRPTSCNGDAQSRGIRALMMISLCDFSSSGLIRNWTLLNHLWSRPI